jgi:hypothetical protein
VNSASIERAYLHSLLAALADPARAADLPPDDPRVAAVARHHRLTPLLWVSCAEQLPAKLAETCRRDRVITAARNMMLGQAAEECLRALAGEGVPAVVLKGLAYEAELYGTPGVRPTADVDLLVPAHKRRAAFSTLDRLGFEPRAAAPGFDEPDYHEVAWTLDGVEVDLHMALAPLVRCHIDYAAIWREVQPLRIGDTEALTLARPHAVIFQALHMAIDHFDVPAIYLVDLARLLDEPGVARLAETSARIWGCHRPLSTALALLEAFIPGTAGQDRPEPISRWTRRVVDTYGSRAPLPRAEQFLRKLTHFDGLRDALRYVEVQSRRNLRERFERRFRKRTARARLAL